MPKTYTTKIIGYEFNELDEDIQRDWYTKDSECLYYDAEECFIQPLIEGFQEELSEDYGAADIDADGGVDVMLASQVTLSSMSMLVSVSLMLMLPSTSVLVLILTLIAMLVLMMLMLTGVSLMLVFVLV